MDTKRFVREQWDRVAGWGSIALAALVLLLGWLGVSDTVYPAEQLPYILSGGVFGLFLLGVGSVLLLSADLRDEWRKLDSIEEAIRASNSATPAAAATPPMDAAHEPSTNGAAKSRRTPLQAQR